MVGTALTIEKEMEDARNTRVRELVVRGRKASLLPVQGRDRELLVHEGPRVAAI